MKSLLPQILALLMALLLGACTLINQVDDIQPLDFNPGYAIPVAKTSVSMADLLDSFSPDGVLEVDSDGLLVFTYDTTLVIYDGNDYDGVIDFESQVFDTLTTLNLGPLLSQSLTRATLKGGWLTYFVEVDNPGNYTLTIEIPDAVKNGEPLRLQRSDLFDASVSGQVSLEGYEIIAPAEEVQVKTILRETGTNDLEIPRAARLGFNDLAFSYLQGRAISYTFLNEVDSVQPNIFPKNISGKVYFSDPSLRLTFKNSFGIPLQFTINDVVAKGSDGSRLNLEADAISETLELDYPSISQRGETRNTSFLFDKDNSNIVEVLSLIPQEFKYNFLSSAIYQAGSSADPDFFLADTSSLKMEMNFRLPMDLRVEDFTFYDTLGLDVDFGELSVSGEAEFKLISENAIPFAVNMQVYFMDDLGVRIDSLFETYGEVLGAASVDEEGEVIEPAIKEFFFTVNKERLNSLSAASRLEVKSSFRTSHQPNKTVKLYEDATLGLKLGVKTSVGQ